MRKSGPRRDLMERELIERAAEIFAERGFANTTLQDIADAAKVRQPVSPTLGPAATKILDEVYATPAEIIAIPDANWPGGMYTRIPLCLRIAMNALPSSGSW